MFAVVEQDDDAVLLQSRDDATYRLIICGERRTDRCPEGRTKRHRLVDGSELHHPDPIGPTVSGRQAPLANEARLADASGADDRHQPACLHEAVELLQVGLSAD
jgi:hypothetical protein